MSGLCFYHHPTPRKYRAATIEDMKRAMELVKMEEGSRTKEIAEAMQVNPSTANRLLGIAEARGLVLCVADPRTREFGSGVRWYRYGDVPVEEEGRHMGGYWQHAAFRAHPLVLPPARLGGVGLL